MKTGIVRVSMTTSKLFLAKNAQNTGHFFMFFF